MQIPEIFIFEKNSTDYIIDAKCFFLITMIKIAVGKEWLQLFFLNYCENYWLQRFKSLVFEIVFTNPFFPFLQVNFCDPLIKSA